MVFKKMMRALGSSGVKVDTVLTQSGVQPGSILNGEIHLSAEEKPAEIEYITLSLATRVERESGDHEYAQGVDFHHVDVVGAFTLGAHEERSIPFAFPIPWEAPLTSVYGQHLRGMKLGLRTDVSIAKAIDKGDLDPVAIEPLPAQLKILEAFENLGFRFKGADLEQGRIYGVQQELPFYQEIEYYSPGFASGINEVELTFVTNPSFVEVILEVDKRGGFFSEGSDTYRRFSVPHDGGSQDWTAEIDAWIRNAMQYSGHYGGHHGHYDDDHHSGGGMGWGAVAGGAAAGFVGGMVAGEVMEEVFDED